MRRFKRFTTGIINRIFRKDVQTVAAEEAGYGIGPIFKSAHRGGKRVMEGEILLHRDKIGIFFCEDFADLSHPRAADRLSLGGMRVAQDRYARYVVGHKVEGPGRSASGAGRGHGAGKRYQR